MSLVDYAIAVRRRPEWRRVRLQPGLWLAWAVMITALLMALAPQWFTSANALSAWPRKRTTGWVPTSWGATCGRGWFTARYIPCRRR